MKLKISGCRDLEFQLWDPKYLKPGPWDNDGRRKICKKAYLDDDKYSELFNYSSKIGLNCFASVFNSSDYDRLKKVSTKFIKIPSPEAYDLELIEKLLMTLRKFMCQLVL